MTHVNRPLREAVGVPAMDIHKASPPRRFATLGGKLIGILVAFLLLALAADRDVTTGKIPSCCTRW